MKVHFPTLDKAIAEVEQKLDEGATLFDATVMKRLSKEAKQFCWPPVSAKETILKVKRQLILPPA